MQFYFWINIFGVVSNENFGSHNEAISLSINMVTKEKENGFKTMNEEHSMLSILLPDVKP